LDKILRKIKKLKMKFYLISILYLFIINAVLAADEVSFTGTWSSSQYNKGELPDY